MPAGEGLAAAEVHATSRLTKATIDGHLDRGELPFVDCPGDGLSIAGVELRDGWVVICGLCSGSQYEPDLQWLTPQAAMGRGWAVWTPDHAPAPVVH